MFSVTPPEPEVAHAELRALRVCLNTPVVVIEGLPVGPAAAGIALHQGAEGPLLTLAVRSVRTGRVVLFRPDEEWVELHGPELVMDAALSFAESMGFLFDDDPIQAGGGAREAARLWSELVRETPLGQDEGQSEEELWLEEVAPAAPAVLLTKFRFLPGLGSAPRIAAPLRDDGAPPRDFWIRLLSRF